MKDPKLQVPRQSVRPPSIRPERLPKILLVEDDRIIVRTVLRCLNGYAEIIVADTADSAWTAYELHQDSFTLIVLDGLLRNSNSIDLLRRIRGLNFSGPIVSTTSNQTMRESMFPPPIEGKKAPPCCDEHVKKEHLIDYLFDHIAKINA